MADNLFDAVTLSQGLDVAARRRMWIVGRFLEHSLLSEIDCVLSLAAKVEAFIINGFGSNDAVETKVGAQNYAEAADLQRSNQIASQVSPLATNPASSINAVSQSRGGRAVRYPLLDQETKARFIHEAARNPDNRHLARIFGLSVRQTHAIRVGVSKYIATARREYELQMQDEFLKNKVKSGPTMDDVVRYLRQRDDVVVPTGQHYVVNSNLALTAEELIERANRKRREHNQEPLAVQADEALCATSASGVQGGAGVVAYKMPMMDALNMLPQPTPN